MAPRWWPKGVPDDKISKNVEEMGPGRQGRPGTARHGEPGDLWHGPARKIMARKNIGTARPGKSWHGKILARHGPKKYHKIVFLGKIILGRKIRDFLPGSKIPLLAIHKIISHIWEDRSRKVNNDEPDLRFFHGNF